jgi:hypothetical protein
MVLGPETGIVVFKSQANDYQTLSDEILHLKPEIIILEGSGKMAEKGLIAHLMETHPMLKILVIQEDSNFIHIFRKDEVALEKTGDLIKAIRSV